VNDDILIGRAQEGDENAFTELIRTRVDGLYAVAYRIVRDAATAEDATQQAMLEAWRKLPQLRDAGRFDGWLYRLVANAAKRELLRQRSWTAKLRVVRSEASSSRDTAVGVVLHDELEHAFAALTPDHRIVVVLRHYLGWSSAEIAAELGLPAGTVASRIHYGLAALRRALNDEENADRPHALEGRR
jgi:RNA polymerase sigma-70 factor, ECF subfamily